MNRVDFFESVSGIQYPEMVVNFFDHFVALKQIVEDSGKVYVLSVDNRSIQFKIDFDDQSTINNAYATIVANGQTIIVYNRPIRVEVEALTGCCSLLIKLS